jgi:hypothetical protein
LTRELWVPGSAEPSLDDFVGRVVKQIERYTETHAAERSHVEVELGDGQRVTVQSLSSEPGYGFLTLTLPEGEQLVVPVGGIRRITLGPADEDRRPGFALPSPKEKGPEPAA